MMRMIGKAAGGALAAAVLAGPALAGDVTVAIDGVRAANGPLYVSLQTRAQFLQNEGTYGDIVASPAAGSVTVSLKGVAVGEYSVSVWHDIDGDQVFDRMETGQPLDGWSMLNAASLRAEPTFDAVKFTVGEAGAAIDLDMFYAD